MACSDLSSKTKRPSYTDFTKNEQLGLIIVCYQGTVHNIINLCNAEIFLYKPWRQRVFFKFESIINFFEYICYGSTAFSNSLILSLRGSTLDVRI